MLRETDRVRLLHMIEATSEALQYVKGRTRASLESEPPIKHLLVRDLEILGEAASRISPDLCARHPEVPWRTIVNTRNRLIHAYFDIDLDIVWSTATQALPELLPKLQHILGSGNADSSEASR